MSQTLVNYMGLFDFLAPVAQTISNAVNSVVQPIVQIVHPIIQSVVSPVIATAQPIRESIIQVAQLPITPPIYRPLGGFSAPLTLQEVGGLVTAGVAAAAAAPTIVAAAAAAAPSIATAAAALGAKEAAIAVAKQLAIHVVAIPVAIEIGGLIAGVPLPKITPLALGVATTGALGFGIAGKIGAILGITGLLSAVVISKVPEIQTKIQTVKETVTDLPPEIANELKDLKTQIETLTKQKTQEATTIIKSFSVEDVKNYISQHPELFTGVGAGVTATALLTQREDLAKLLNEAKDILLQRVSAKAKTPSKRSRTTRKRIAKRRSNRGRRGRHK